MIENNDEKNEQQQEEEEEEEKQILEKSKSNDIANDDNNDTVISVVESPTKRQKRANNNNDKNVELIDNKDDQNKTIDNDENSKQQQQQQQQNAKQSQSSNTQRRVNVWQCHVCQESFPSRRLMREHKRHHRSTSTRRPKQSNIDQSTKKVEIQTKTFAPTVASTPHRHASSRSCSTPTNDVVVNCKPTVVFISPHLSIELREELRHTAESLGFYYILLLFIFYNINLLCLKNSNERNES